MRPQLKVQWQSYAVHWWYDKDVQCDVDLELLLNQTRDVDVYFEVDRVIEDEVTIKELL